MLGTRHAAVLRRASDRQADGQEHDGRTFSSARCRLTKASARADAAGVDGAATTAPPRPEKPRWADVTSIAWLLTPRKRACAANASAMRRVCPSVVAKNTGSSLMASRLRARKWAATRARWPRPDLPRRCTWAQRDLQHPFPLGAEEIERLVDVVEPEAMRDQRAEVDAAVRDHRHQPAHPLLAARAERRHDPLIAQAGVDRLVGRDELAGIDAEARERAAGTDRAQRVLERLLPSQRLDRHVDAAAAGQPLDLGDADPVPGS